MASKNKGKSETSTASTPDKDGPDAAPATASPEPVHLGGTALVDRLAPHAKKLAVAFAAVIVLLAVFFTYRWTQERKALKQTAVLVQAVEIARRTIVVPPAVDPVDPADPADPAVEPGADETKPVTYGSAKERAEAALAALAGAGKARGAGPLFEASLLVDAGKLDEADAIYARIGKGSGADAVVGREGQGYVAEMRAQAAKDPAERQRLLEQALEAFRRMQPDDKGPRRDYALYHEARILTLLDKRDDARAALEKALEVKETGSDIELDIEQRLAQLEAAR